MQKKLYLIKLIKANTKFYLSLHYNAKFKAKNSEIAATSLCLGNISKDFSVDNMKKTGLNGYVYDFSVIMMLLQLMIY